MNELQTEVKSEPLMDGIHRDIGHVLPAGNRWPGPLKRATNQRSDHSLMPGKGFQTWTTIGTTVTRLHPINGRFGCRPRLCCPRRRVANLRDDQESLSPA